MPSLALAPQSYPLLAPLPVSLLESSIVALPVSLLESSIEALPVSLLESPTEALLEPLHESAIEALPVLLLESQIEALPVLLLESPIVPIPLPPSASTPQPPLCSFTLSLSAPMPFPLCAPMATAAVASAAHDSHSPRHSSRVIV